MSALDKALEYSKKLRIDECEIVHVKRKITTVRITDSEIFELKQNLDENYGIRIIHDKKIASIQTSDDSIIQKSMEDSLQTISHLKPREFWKSLPGELKSKNNLEGVYDKKLEEISEKVRPDVIIFDEILKPSQNYNLATVLHREVLDREALILEIFESRASSAESKLQVKLAQLRYEMVRAKEN